MTPADEATFITLWQQGLETAEIARRLGLKATTAQSRAHCLQQRGLIEPRPRGGEYPSLREKARGVDEREPSTVHPDTWELKPLKHSVRWTIYVPQALQDEIKRRAAARGQPPSLLVQEALARWLAAEAE